jgi:D-glycerate 3-kinase
MQEPMTTQTIADLIRAEALPPHYATIVGRWWRPLADAIADRHATLGRGTLIGINGAQGTGKSTLCLFLELLLREGHHLHAVTLSLDDLYMTKAERRRLARDAHPLFATRGVPSTHDLPLGLSTIDALLLGTGPVDIPRFDKSTDDRAPRSDWPVIEAPVDIVLFEGWCVGARPADPASLAKPVNALERDEDRDGGWRTAVNQAVAGPYTDLFARLDWLVMLAPPGFAQVREWRQLQERKLRERTGKAMDDAQVIRFVDHYERLTRHMLAVLPQRADILIPIGANHQPLSLAAKKSGEPFGW